LVLNRELSTTELTETATVGSSGYMSGEQSTSNAALSTTVTDKSGDDLTQLRDETYRSRERKSVGTTSENDDDDDTFSSNSSFDEDDEDDLFRDFMPKKSCLKTRRNQNQLFIDTTSANAISMDAANATSSPLYPVEGGLSPNSSSSLSLSSLGNGSTLNTSNSISSNSSASTAAAKKRVSFADNCGKELFTVRTMSEPSNCPPKLTSKIVQYFLNREFSSNGQAACAVNTGANSVGFSQNLNYLLQSQLSNPNFNSSKSFS
jgi:hypothetical protein